MTYDDGITKSLAQEVHIWENLFVVETTTRSRKYLYCLSSILRTKAKWEPILISIPLVRSPITREHYVLELPYKSKTRSKRIKVREILPRNRTQ